MRTILTSLTAVCALSATAASPWLHKVYDFVPAPGQYVNVAPEYEEGDTREIMLSKVEELICGESNPGMISLGAFGGYVVIGFDHPVVNVAGQYDFKIFGNAIISDESNNGGSSEPAIVMVSEDVNGNGLPDDPWFELAGSEYNNPATHHNVTVKYFRPDNNKTPEPDPDNFFITDRTYIRFTSDDPSHAEGYIPKVTFHTQSYWPEWLADIDELEFSSISCLPDNYVNIGTDQEEYYVQKFYDYGYADNRPNADDNGFDIGWAVDESGNPVHLNGIHFIKIYTAVNQTCGWLGEASSEVAGGEDLHPDEVYVPSAITAVSDMTVASVSCRGGVLKVSVDRDCALAVYNTAGSLVLNQPIAEGKNIIDVSSLCKGVYIITIANRTYKVII